jgi:Protein of unknown function (DUF3738)/Histidine kinase-, DNA gyrase B-, and HSP90-like ATPase
LKLQLNSRRQIFLIYKECMHNAVKHSGCRCVSVAFDLNDSEAVMTVADDGRGWDPPRPTALRKGNGLANIRRRAQSLGGSVEFGARPGGGCQVTLLLPVRRQAFGGATAPPAPASDQVALPDLFTAFQQQLGLRLEAVKAPVSVIVIDRVEKPSAN